MKKLITSFCLLLQASFAFSQITSANMQVSGLTCSMCNLSVRKSLQKLTFIESLVPNVENATYAINFKKTEPVKPIEMAKSVQKAGFSVAKLVIDVDLKKVEQLNTTSFKIKESKYVLLDGTLTPNLSNAKFQVMGKDYITDKEFKKNQKKFQPAENVIYIIKA
jgi:copper chaperone CopZ